MASAKAYQYQATPNQYQLTANSMFVVITHLRCGCAIRDGCPPCERATQFQTGRTWVPPHSGPRGSPFQLPARLADGLGPGSDLGHGCPRPFAPSPESPGSLVPPRQPSGRKAGLGCSYFIRFLDRTSRTPCQMARLQHPYTQLFGVMLNKMAHRAVFLISI